MINSIQTETGSVSFDPIEINDTFKQFYTCYNTSESPENLSKISEFLSTVELPKLGQEDQSSLDRPFAQKETEKALGSLQANKSPDEDGFPPEFYGEFKDLLIPLVMDIINLASKTQTLPNLFSTTMITVIHKKNRDPLKCSSFQPISLLNTDYKLISKALANRLGEYLPQLINPEQSGFVSKATEPSITVSLDADKAFAGLKWPYLFKALAKLGFGLSFINWVKNWVKINSHKSQAKLSTNGQILSTFPLSRSSRQGCPLSPGLFVLAIEPLAEAIRQDKTSWNNCRQGLQKPVQIELCPIAQ